MKQGKLAPVTNVREADKSIEYLLNRPRLEMVGLGLLYGHPGLGKTTYAQRMAFSRGWMYLRLESLMTAKSFAVMFKSALMRHLGLGNHQVHGTTAGIFGSIKSLLAQHPEVVIIVDEIDYAFGRPEILGALRDLVDETVATIILVGMQNAKDKLLQINRYYYDRCGVFYEFKAPTKKDIAMLCATVMEVKFGEDIVTHIHDRNHGTLRDTMSLINSLEAVAKAKGIEQITVRALEG